MAAHKSRCPTDGLTDAMTVVKNYFGQRQDVAFAYLFGSKARGTAGPLSDTDVAVYLTERPFPENRLAILGDLIDILRTDTVDLVLLNMASEGLKARIIREKVILADNLPFVRRRFESQTMRRYMDFSKMEQRILKQRYLNG